MRAALDMLGNAAGIAGVLLCLAAGITRALGHFHLAGFEAMTVFIAGTGVMVAAVLAKLHALSLARAG